MNTGEGGLSPYHLEGRCDIVYLIGTTKYGVRTPEGELSDDKLRGIAEHKQVRVFDITRRQTRKRRYFNWR
jgi:glutamate synthase domain-containing protein 2